MRSRLGPFLASAFCAAIVALAACLASGCGASALRDNARAATVVSVVLETAGDAADAARTARLDEVEHAVRNSPDRDEIIRREAAQWEPLGAALDACRDALLSWIGALEVANLAEETDLTWEVFVPLVMRVVLLYDDVQRLANTLGATLPELPAIVRALAVAPDGR